MSSKFLDKEGLAYLWYKMKNYINNEMDKNKVKALNYVVDDVPTQVTHVFTLSDDFLASVGITNVLDWEVIGVSAYIQGDDLTVYGAHDVSGAFVLPNLVHVGNDGLQVSIKNIYDTTKTFTVKIVMMKVN